MGENNLKKRIRNAQCREKIMSAEEAASFIRPGMTIGSSGFTPAGYPKMIPAALAKRAEAGEKLDLTLLTGAPQGMRWMGVPGRAGVQEKNSVPDQQGSAGRHQPGRDFLYG